jgi:putative ABC transport system permease protein
MIFREILRFLRRGNVAAILAGVVLTVGFTAAAITFNLIRALTHPQDAALQNETFATIAQQAPAEGLSGINWYTVEHLRNALWLPHSSMVAYAHPSNYQLQWQKRAAEISIAFTQDGFFGKFTNNFYAGGDFTPGWESGVDEGQAIVSESFSRRFFGSADNALHQDIKIAGQTFTVVGIAPKGFGGLWSTTDVWTTPDQAERLVTAAFQTSTIHSDAWKRPSIWYLLVVTGPGIRPAPVQTLDTQLRDEKNRSLHLQAVIGLTDDPVRDRNVHASSQLSFVVALALLLSASLNYCILLFARSSLYVEEFRLKRVLGASSRRLALDATIGPLFVVFASFLMSGVATVFLDRLLEAREINPVVASGLGIVGAVRMLAIEFPLACILGASIALVPALSLMRRSDAPKIGSTTTLTAREGLILNGIVVLEITVCTLICLFSGTFVREYYLLSKVSLGFDPRHLTSYEANIITKGGGTLSFQTTSGKESPMEAFVRLSMLGSEQLSGLHAIAAASCTPFGPSMKTIDVYRFESGIEPLRGVSFCTVSQTFFSATGTNIYDGSGFTRTDYTGDVNHVVISRSLARSLWPKQDAVNQMIRVDEPGSHLRFDVRVVGVADDTRQAGSLSSPQPTIYLPLTGNALVLSFPIYFLARGNQSTEKFGEIVQRQSQSTVNHLGIVRSYSIEESVNTAWQEQKLRLNLALIGSALVALIAYVGLYGVLIHSISARQKELALRLSFGSSRWALRRVVIGKAVLCCFTAICLALLLWRVCFGLLDSAWMSGASWSWEASGITSLLCAIAAVAVSLIPAGRVARISPATLLKGE